MHSEENFRKHSLQEIDHQNEKQVKINEGEVLICLSSQSSIKTIKLTHSNIDTKKYREK